jgi:hypothetical protein
MYGLAANTVNRPQRAATANRRGIVRLCRGMNGAA